MANANDVATLTGDIISELRGRMGHRVYYMRNGRICSRSRVIPSNPRSKNQQAGRSRFALLVKRWRSLDGIQRARWNHRARGLNMSGYNLYISNNMKKSTVSRRTAFLITPSGARRPGTVRPAPRVVPRGPLPRARGRDPAILQGVLPAVQPFLSCHGTRRHGS